MNDPLTADGKNRDECAAIPKDNTDAVMRKKYMRSYYF
jgi:hypothetical protein